MRFNGHVDAVRNHVYEGWAADMDALDSPVVVELLVDDVVLAQTTADRHRPDLLTAGIGNGDHGFTLALPAQAFDGHSHRLALRAQGAEQPLPGLESPQRLTPQQNPDFTGTVTALEGPWLRGLAYSRAADATPVLVDLLLDGRIVASLFASRPGPAELDRRPCAFAFDLAALWTPQMLGGRLQCRIAGLQDALPAPGLEYLAERLRLDQVRCDDTGIRGRLQLPAFIPSDTEFDIALDGKSCADGLTWSEGRNDPGTRQRLFGVDLPRALPPGLLTLELRLQGQHQALLTQRVWSRPDVNLLQDPFFDHWDGPRLRHWESPTPLPGRLLPEHCLLNLRAAETPTFGSLALRYDAPGQGLDAPLNLLTQTLDASLLPPGETLEFKLVAQLDAPATADVMLELETSSGSIPLQVPLRLRPRWTSDRAVLSLPASPAPYRSARLSLVLQGLRGSFHLAAVGLGPRGFRLQRVAPSAATTPPTLAPGVPAQANAVPNGMFEDWSRGLSFTGSIKRFEAADGWMMFSKNPRESVSVGLDKIVARDPAAGDAGREVFGLGLSGPAEGLTRLEVALDPLSLAAEPDVLRLHLCARPSRPFAPARKPTQVQRILLLSRSTSIPEEGGEPLVRDDTLAVIARRVAVGAMGRYASFPLLSASIDWSRYASAEADATVPQVILAFEFEGPLDCTLADVYVGRRDADPNTAYQREPGYVGLEDANIAAQIGLIKGIDAWLSREPLRLAPGQAGPRLVPASDAATPGPWRWPHNATASAEIVIPVFNAPDEVMNCLRSIERNTGMPHLLTLVDDASDELTARQLAEYARTRPWVRLIRNEQNLGYTRSSNIGMARSTAQWVVLLNSDTLVGPHWLEGLLDCAQSDPAIKFVGALSNAASWQSVPEIFDASGKWKVNQLPEGWSVDDMARLVARVSPRAYPRVPLLNGFCTLMERRTLEELGFLDEAAFPVGYGEENDLCLRATQAGHQLAIADQVYVYHVKSASFGSARRAGLAKQGMANLMLKHPQVDLAAAQQQLGAIEPLRLLRERLTQTLGSAADNLPAAST